MSKTKIRVDSVRVYSPAVSTFSRRDFEKFLQGVADEGWELLQMVRQGDYILTVHRKVIRWWAR